MVKISYDPEVDALYIRLKETTVTTGRIEEGVSLDYDAAGRIAGIEVLDVGKRLDDLEAIHRFDVCTTASDENAVLGQHVPLRLGANQQQVLDALRCVETEDYPLGDWYLGALYALENPYNPDRISQAAQSLRELVEKLPRVVRESHGHSKRSNFPEMRRRIFTRLENDKERYGGVWKGKVIDSQLDKTLMKTFHYIELNQQPTRRDQLQIAIRKIDPMADQMAFDVQKQKRDAFYRLWGQLQDFAHHRTRNPENEQTFRVHLATLEQMVYDLLAPITAQDQDEIQTILNRSEHSEADAATVHRLISRRGANYVYFFANATDPEWIPFLKKMGFFRSPPHAEYSSDGYVRFPFWPELQYLDNVCVHAPEDVLELVLQIPAVDNPRVYDDILDIALKLDGERSGKLKPKMLEYAKLETPFLPFQFPELLAHWTSEGQTEAALELARILVRFAPDPNAEEKRRRKRKLSEDHADSSRNQIALMMTILRPMPRFNENFREILNEGVRPLAEKEPYKVARMLIDATKNMIHHEVHEHDSESSESCDYTKRWCQRLDKSDNSDPEPAKSLVHTLTYACEMVYERASESIGTLDRALRKQRWYLFKRLRQHLYALYPSEQTRPWIQEMILGYSEYGKWEHHFELQRMIRLSFKHLGAELLTEDQRIQIFETILSGPPEDDFREWMGEQFTNSAFVHERRNFHRRQLRPFARVLSGEYADYFQRLEAHENAEEITDESYSAVTFSEEDGIVTSRSPRSSEELANLSDETLLVYINDWEDEHRNRDDGLTEIDIESLAGAFQEVFKDCIIPNAVRLDFWIRNRDNILRPIYVRAMVDAMRDHVRAKNYDELEKWFTFCEFVLSHHDSKNEEGVGIGRMGDGSREHPNRHTSRRAVCDFIEACIDEDVDVPLWAREHLAGLLDMLCTQYDWRLDNDKPVLLNREDQLTEAINTTRGRALENLIKFGFWVRRHDDKASIPEMREIVEKRVSTEASYPLTLPEYAVLGMRFGSLFHLDEQWAVSRKSLLFPQNNLPAWREAFGNFLRRGRPNRPIIAKLRDQFEFALEHLKYLKELEWTGGESAGDFLGQHLFTYYLWDVYPLKGDDSLLERYYLKTDGERRHWARLFNYVGHSLRNTGRQLDEGLKVRIIALFEWRLEVGEPTELQEFVFWLEAECLEGEWRLNAYSKIVKLLRNLNWDQPRNQTAQLQYQAIHSIREMLLKHTVTVVKCFTKLSRLRKGGREGFVLVDSDAYRDVSWCRDFTATCGAST